MFSKQLSVLQRQTIRVCGATVVITAGLAFFIREAFDAYHPTGTTAYLLAILPAIPLIGTFFLAIRYFRREKDEFVRMLVVQALLWGFAVPMIIGTFWGFLSDFCRIRPAPQMLYVDLFLVSTMIALRVLRGRYA